MKKQLADYFKDEYGKMVGFVRKSIKDSGDKDAEDIVQDVFYSLSSRPDFSGPIESAVGYIYQSLRNRVVDTFRVRKNHQSLDKSLKEGEDGTLLDVIEGNFETPEVDLEKKRAKEELYAAMDRTLKESEKSVVVATEIEGYKFEELSKKWNIPLNTLLSRKSRAMKKLQGRLLTSITV